MSRMKKLHEVTIRLHEAVAKDSEDQREEKIEKINHLLQEREEILKEVKPPYTDAEKQIGRHLLPINQEIDDKLQSVFFEIKKDMATMKKKKSSNTKYTNPYKNLSNYDGMFLDHKK
ncbi:flagellar protein FliT [Aquibacillus koreensis]|uniref:Flagellar protein FliT n=1 Tax=Aquibacillus koreensis TaxID=279446 RepID=A0A9X3WMS0_9BACI|nr:flagellar protein FliT [Aquibacillus koreensis]MCT2537271.1 flagellar protein FliT [Aquibacillus koreensis]MDC3421618.1 flagellar protein FliT [Aquibacillus koreensis]